jgi:carboxyl-terminal processing protease
LRGPEGTDVSVTIRREGLDEDFDVALTRRVIETPSVPYAFMTDDDIGYLRLANFSEKAGAETREAIRDLRKQGARGLVFDLRQNPGGLLDQAVEVAEQLLPKGTLVVYTDGRVKSQNHRYYAAENRPELRWPVVVLVDQGSASASEIVAGSLQDMDRALVLGSTTFGKGSVQSVFPLADRRAALKLTTALYRTPSGRAIHKQQNGHIGEVLALNEEFDEEGEPVAAMDEEQANRPVYQTAAGRPVYGGGGIAPDLSVVPDSLPPVVLRVERATVPFKFANSWVNTHEGVGLESTVSKAQWNAYVALIRELDDPPALKDIEAQRPALERGLRRELARRLEGDAAAARVALDGDPIFQRARRVLESARKPGDVFAAVESDTEAPSRTASR